MAIAAVDEARRVKLEYVGAVLLDKNRRVIVSETSSGHLYCVTESTVWCDHIAQSVVNGLDAEPLHKQLKVVSAPMYRVVTPVLPSEHLFCDIQLVPFERIPGTYKAMLEEPGATPSGSGVAMGNGIFLGFFNPGEGRKHLRQMLLNWMENDLQELRSTACSSTRHDWKRKAVIATECHEDKKNRRQRLLFHNWCLMWWRKCGYCFQEEGPKQNQFDPDLIPGA